MQNKLHSQLKEKKEKKIGKTVRPGKPFRCLLRLLPSKKNTGKMGETVRPGHPILLLSANQSISNPSKK